MFQTILFPTDGSSLSERACKAALEFAKINGSKIVVLSVAELYPLPMLPEASSAADLTFYEDTMKEAAKKNVASVSAMAAAAGVPCETVTAQSFNPYEEIVATAKKFGCDLIWMASHGRKGINRILLGSQAQKVLVHTEIPVLIYREEAQESAPQ